MSHTTTTNNLHGWYTVETHSAAVHLSKPILDRVEPEAVIPIVAYNQLERNPPDIEFDLTNIRHKPGDRYTWCAEIAGQPVELWFVHAEQIWVIKVTEL